MERDNDLNFIDILTVISAIAVVLLHTNGIFWSRPTGSVWLSANFIETFFYYAVPIFFMITGSTLIDYRERYSTVVFFKKRFFRTFIPFIVWSIIAYLFCKIIGHKIHLENGLLMSIFNNRVMGIYWFFVPLFACYLSIVPLSYVENKNFVFIYMSVYAFVTISILPVASKYFNIPYNQAIDTPISGGYILYILLGWIFTNLKIKKSIRGVIYILGILGWFIHFYMTIYLTGDGKIINMMFKGYLNFPCVLHSIAIFVFIKYCDFSWINKNIKLKKVMRDLKEASLGIYLIHGFFVYFIVPKLAHKLSFENIGSSLWYRIFGAVIIIIICTYMTKFIKKTKLGRLILG